MPKLPSRFAAYPVRVTLDGAGNGALSFQAVGDNVRISNISVKVATATLQATATIYKQFVGEAYRISGTNSGSTGDNAGAAVDLMDGERLFVVWAGGDPGAIATATFSGYTLPFSERGTSQSVDWTNPIAAGDGSLIYPAIKSPNYVPGVSGWQIDRDGSAEFNDVEVRGTLHVDGPGISAIDIYVRSVPEASGVFIPVIDFTVDNDVFTPSSLYAYEDPPFVYFVLEGSRCVNNVGELPARVIVRSDASDATSLDELVIIDADSLNVLRYDSLGNLIANGAVLNVYGDIVGTRDLSLQRNIAMFGDIRLGPQDTVFQGYVGRGLHSRVAVLTDSSAIGSTETGALQIVSTTYKANRAYRVVINTSLTVASAPGAVLHRLRKDTTGGQLICNFGGVWCGTTGARYHGNFTEVFTVGNADVTCVLLATITGGTTFTGQQLGPRAMDVYDVGPAIAYGTRTVLT